MVKLDSDGNISWQTMLGGSGDDIGYSIRQTDDNGYIVVGSSDSFTVAGPTLLLAPHGAEDCYIVKIDADRNISWQTMLGGFYEDYGYAVQQTADNGYIVKCR